MSSHTIDKPTIYDIAQQYSTVYEYEPINLCDVILSIDNNTSICFKLHKYILTIQSQYFSNIIKNNINDNIIILPNTFIWSTTDLKHFIDILYGTNNITVEQFQFRTNPNDIILYASTTTTQPIYNTTQILTNNVQQLVNKFKRNKSIISHSIKKLEPIDLIKQLQLCDYFNTRYQYDIIQSIISQCIDIVSPKQLIYLLRTCDQLYHLMSYVLHVSIN